MGGVGTVDGSHIPILALLEYHTVFPPGGMVFYYFKGSCWWKRFVLECVNPGQPGSLHDVRFLSLSALWDLAERGGVYFHTRVGTLSIGCWLLHHVRHCLPVCWQAGSWSPSQTTVPFYTNKGINLETVLFLLGISVLVVMRKNVLVLVKF